MIKRYFLRYIQCNTCRKGLVGNANLLVTSELEIKVLAETLHEQAVKDGVMICTNPQLFAFPETVLDLTTQINSTNTVSDNDVTIITDFNN